MSKLSGRPNDSGKEQEMNLSKTEENLDDNNYWVEHYNNGLLLKLQHIVHLAQTFCF